MHDLELWLKELRLSGYRVSSRGNRHCIDNGSYSLLLDCLGAAGFYLWTWDDSHSSASFTDFDEMSEWVEERLKTW